MHQLSLEGMMHYHTLDELKALLRELPTDRHRLAAKVQFWHGLRASEVLSLRGSDIQGGHVSFMEHDDPALDEAKELRELAGTLKRADRVFPMYSDTPDYTYKRGKKVKSNSTRGRFGWQACIRRAGRRIGLSRKKSRTHAFKHDCGMANIGLGIHYAQAVLGHVNIASTAPYISIGEQQAYKAFQESARNLGDLLK
jgi:integrase